MSDGMLLFTLQGGPLDGDLLRVPLGVSRVGFPCDVMTYILTHDEGEVLAEIKGEPSHLYVLKAGVFRYAGIGRPLPDFFAVAG